MTAVGWSLLGLSLGLLFGALHVDGRRVGFGWYIAASAATWPVGWYLLLLEAAPS